MWSRLFKIDNRYLSSHLLGNTILAVQEVYPMDGMDHVTQTVDGKAFNHHHFKYATRLKTLLFAFLGIPNRNLATGFFKNLWLNLISWQPKRSIWLLVLMGMFALPYHLIAMPFKLALNIVKGVTEFAPAWLMRLFIARMLLIENAVKIRYPYRYNTGEKQLDMLKLSNFKQYPLMMLFDYATIFVFIPMLVFLYAWQRVGKCTTSAIDHVREMWHLGSSTWLGGFAGLAAVAGVIALTTVIYTLCFPLATHALAGAVIPFMQANFSVALDFLVKTTQLLTPLLDIPASFSIHLAAAVVAKMTLGFINLQPFLALHPTAVGLGTFTSLMITFPGTLVHEILNSASRAWHRPSTRRPPPKEEEHIIRTTAQLKQTFTKGKQHAVEEQPDMVASTEFKTRKRKNARAKKSFRFMPTMAAVALLPPPKRIVVSAPGAEEIEVLPRRRV